VWRSFKVSAELVEILVASGSELVKATKRSAMTWPASSAISKRGRAVKSLNLPRLRPTRWRHETGDIASPRCRRREAQASPASSAFSSGARLHQVPHDRHADDALAPSLKGSPAEVDYLIESFLFPSKIIKPAFETATVTTKDGVILAASSRTRPGAARAELGPRGAGADGGRRGVARWRACRSCRGPEATLSRARVRGFDRVSDDAAVSLLRNSPMPAFT